MVDIKGLIINVLNIIIYERIINKNEVDFLVDIEVIIDDGFIIIMDFNSKDFDMVGIYIVILNVEDVSGNKVMFVKVIMKVEDNIFFIIIVD